MIYAGKKKDSNFSDLMYTYIYFLPKTASETTGIDQLDLMFTSPYVFFGR